MPKKTKETNDLQTKEPTKTKSKVKSTKTNAKATSTVKKATTSSKKTATAKTKAKSASRKSTASTKTSKTTSSKAKSTSTKAKSASSKKTSKGTSKKVTKKSTTTRKKKTEKKPQILEYYDLPYRYNQTVVKLLAQTPTTLFVYWDISDKDRKSFKEQYGENFFETTKPILIVYNDTLGYSFEVEINDFANSWYLHVADSKCEYRIELGRRTIQKTEKLNQDYIYITTSNEIESPNNKILLDKNQKMVYFRNVKTGNQTGKSISTMSFIRNMGKIYDIYDLYKAIYKNENVEGIYDSSNPSS